MKSVDPDARLARLERGNRLLTLALALVVTVDVLAPLLRGASSNQVLRTKSVVLEGPHGQHVVLDARGLLFVDAKGKTRAALSLPEESDDVGLYLHGATGAPRIGLSINSDTPALTVINSDGKTVSAILAPESEGTVLTMYDGAERQRLLVGLMSGGPTVELRDESGKLEAMLPIR